MNPVTSRRVLVAIPVLLAAILISVFLLLRLKNRAEEGSQQSADRQSITAPVAGPNQRVTLVVAHDSNQVFRAEEVSIALPAETTLRARQVLRALLVEYLREGSPHPLGKGSDIKDVYFVGDRLAVVDIPSAFVDGHPSGVLLEEMTIASLVETLSVNFPGIRQVKILVDGKERETLAGHADLSTPYDAGDVHKLIAEMQ